MCDIVGCDRPAVSKGLCHRHYKQLQRLGYVDVNKEEPEKNVICKYEGCDKPTYAKGYCQNHYRKMLRGTLDKVHYTHCRIPGCNGEVHAKNLCSKHYRRAVKILKDREKERENKDKLKEILDNISNNSN